MKLILAKLISTIGHPLLTVPMVVIFLVNQYESTKNAWFISGLIILGVIVPVIVKLLKNLKEGSITNFDVSDRNQRKSFYKFLIPILVLVNLVLHFTNQSYPTRLSFGIASLLVLSLQLINLRIKASIHVAINVFLVYLLSQHNLYFALILAILILGIAWSRLVLKRHLLIDLIWGGILGNVFGILFTILLK